MNKCETCCNRFKDEDVNVCEFCKDSSEYEYDIRLSCLPDLSDCLIAIGIIILICVIIY